MGTTRRQADCLPPTAGRPSIRSPRGSGIFWEASVGGNSARLIRDLDVGRGEERTITPGPRLRRGLAGSDGVLRWDESADDGRAEVRGYGLASREAVGLPARAADGFAGATIGRGTVVQPVSELARSRAPPPMSDARSARSASPGSPTS